jgi:hypothetical protein
MVVKGHPAADQGRWYRDRATIAALGWRGGDRLTLTATAGVLIAAATRQHGHRARLPYVLIRPGSAAAAACGQVITCCWPL